MKKIASLFIVFILLFTAIAVSACTDSTPSPKPPDWIFDAPGVVVSSNKNEIYYENKTSKTNIEIAFTEAGLGRKFMLELARKFVYENQGYMITLIGDPILTESVEAKLGGTIGLSDIYLPLDCNWEQWAALGLLEQLDDVYAAKVDGESKGTVYEKTKPMFQEFGNVKGHYYAIPWNEWGTGFFYNEDMFKQYELEVPTTVEELWDVCKAIIEKSNGTVMPFTFPGNVGGYFDFFVSTWWAQDSGLDGYAEFFEYGSVDVYKHTVQPSLGKKHALEAFELFFGNDATYTVNGRPLTSQISYGGKKYNFYNPEDMSKNHIQTQLAFCQGKAAMIPNGSWLEQETKNNNAQFQMKLMPTPFLETAKKDGENKPIPVAYTAGGDFFCVPSGISPARKENAKKFLEFTLKEENLQLYTQACGAPRPFVYDLTSILSKLSVFDRSVLEVINNSATFYDYTNALVSTLGGARKWPNGQPYSKLVFGENGDDANKMCQADWIKAQNDWDSWMATAGLS